MSKKNFKEEMIKVGAVYTDKENHRNNDGYLEQTYWVKGFSISNNQSNVKQNEPVTLIPIENDENMPF